MHGAGLARGVESCLPRWERVAKEVRLGGQVGFEPRGAIRDARGTDGQPTVPFFLGPSGFLECRTFNINIETVCSNLGSWSP